MNPKKIFKSVQALSGWRESAFILALAERALPNLLLYLESYDPDDIEALPDYRQLMASSWSYLIKRPDEALIVALLDQVSELEAIFEEDTSFGAQVSLSCLSLWEQAILSEMNPEKKRGPEASQASLQMVMDFIEFSEGEELSENQLVKLFDSHALVKREFSFQEELTDILRAAKHMSDDLMAELRLLAQDEGVSNLGISLDDE